MLHVATTTITSIFFLLTCQKTQILHDLAGILNEDYCSNISVCLSSAFVFIACQDKDDKFFDVEEKKRSEYGDDIRNGEKGKRSEYGDDIRNGEKGKRYFPGKEERYFPGDEQEKRYFPGEDENSEQKRYFPGRNRRYFPGKTPTEKRFFNGPHYPGGCCEE